LWFLLREILLDCSSSNLAEWDGWSTWHVRESEEVHTRFCVGDLREKCHLEDVSVFGTKILKRILNKLDGEVCTGFIGLSDRWRAVS
jgi:hypothetical protein